MKWRFEENNKESFLMLVLSFCSSFGASSVLCGVHLHFICAVALATIFAVNAAHRWQTTVKKDSVFLENICSLCEIKFQFFMTCIVTFSAR